MHTKASSNEHFLCKTLSTRKKEHEVMNAHKGSSDHKFWDYVENLVFISRHMHLKQGFENLITNTFKRTEFENLFFVFLFFFIW